MVERNITESMLDRYYSNNGRVFKFESEAVNFLQKKKYQQVNNGFKNKQCQTARIYSLRDAIIDKAGSIRGYKQIGYLVSFGGESIDYRECKYKRISKQD